jgi:prepilin-type N-terminal cleavage/methylation domain-containing protein
MIRQLRDVYARRRGEELEFNAGFTLIELLIVIVVLGILAATVVFALSGVTSQSASAACQSDAKSYEIAVSAYENSPQNTTNAAPTGTNQLLSGGPYGQFLHASANNPSYIVALAGDTGTVNYIGSTTIPPVSTSLPAGTVLVGPVGGPLVSFDTETTGSNGTGCFNSKV